MPDQAPTTPLSPAADGPVDGATVVIEAATAEAALTELHQQLGGDARIVEVRRVARGGIAGFFAREVVELHAAPGSPTPAPAPRSAAPSTAPRPAAAVATTSATTSPIDRLLSVDAESDDTVDFATFLRGQLGDEPAPPAPAAPAPAPVTLGAHEALLERATAAARLAVRAATGDHDAGGVVDPATDRVLGTSLAAAPVPVAPVADAPAPAAEVPVDAQVAPTAPAEQPAPQASVTMSAELTEPTPATEAGPAWSVANLVKLGLPAGLVRSLDVADPADDVAWTAALAGALRPVCRPLPTGRSLLIGPRARSVANALGVTATAVGQPIRSRAATVAVAVGSGAAGRRWLERARGTRWLHLVVGGSGWRDLLHLDPLAVSWATTEDVPEAVRLATELGLVLGSGPTGRQVQRARPLDVALVVRDLLPVSTGPSAASVAEGGEQL
ncbi:hypothetical protein [Nitriliruptor alkaliphilus]|uniref:hypothetical protein n=1 Tax=Nitriliruptor alkaliphilus TaxID=427918 RepID=UPI0012EDC352|nr:hypothetical protein [Nitriliruptor alkaliphilus]